MSLLLPLPSDRRARRLLQLYIGLGVYGFSTALMIRGAFGLNPWDVLHQGSSRLTGASIGSCTILVGAIVLLFWVPLRLRPGLGTISNAILIGVAVDASLLILPTTNVLVIRLALLALGIVGNGLATGLYIGAGLGPGPRDGLMTGIAARGHSIRVVRTCLEVSVLAVGFLLGGDVGLGTVAYALAIGPLAHVTIPMFTIGAAAHESAQGPLTRSVDGIPDDGGADDSRQEPNDGAGVSGIHDEQRGN